YIDTLPKHQLRSDVKDGIENIGASYVHLLTKHINDKWKTFFRSIFEVDVKRTADNVIVIPEIYNMPPLHFASSNLSYSLGVLHRQLAYAWFDFNRTLATE